ncbi:uncharacterized protein [Ranitomeya imitator]|uniref:uncharacterized protein n=1 Tax=Ranitomeya imitator TaxID=111125 RepID=UPI0037E721C3
MFPILDKSYLFVHLPTDPQNPNGIYLQCPATGHLYCSSTGTLYRKMMQLIPLSANTSSLNQEKDSSLQSGCPTPRTVQTFTVNTKNTDHQENGHLNLTIESSTAQHIQSDNSSIISNLPCNKNLNVKKADQPIQGSSASINPNTKKKKASKNKTDTSAQANSLSQPANNLSTNLQGSSHRDKKKKKKKHIRKAEDKSVPLKENSCPVSKTKSVSCKLKKSVLNKPKLSITANNPSARFKNPALTTHTTKKSEEIIIEQSWAFLRPFQRRPHPSHRRKKCKLSSECKNYIMASSVHEIIHSRYAKNTNERMPVSQIRAMLSSGDWKLRKRSEWIQQMEEDAIHKYKKMNLEKHNQRLQVKEHNVLHHNEKVWLACTNRTAVNRKDKKSWPLLVKCLHKHPDSTLRQACKHRSFCLRWDGTSYTLRLDHAYYTQIQCHMAVTDTSYAELVVHTRKETTILPVNFDFDFWKQTEATLETFFTNNILPYLKKNKIESNPVSAPLDIENRNDVMEE